MAMTTTTYGCFRGMRLANVAENASRKGCNLRFGLIYRMPRGIGLAVPTTDRERPVGLNTTFSFNSPASANVFDWSTSTNWTANTLPLSTNAVYISAPGTSSFVSVDDLANQTIDTLAIAQGATLDIAAGNTLTLTGSLKALGGTSGGQVVLSGTNTSLILGSQAPDSNAVGIQLTGALETIGFSVFTKGSVNGAITGFGVNDKLDLQGFSSVTSITDTANNLTVTGTYLYNATSYPTSISFTNFSTIAGTALTSISDGNGGILIEGVTCFAAGTSLLTPTGERLVEDLQEGDLVLTQDGETTTPRPITWVGRMRVDLARHPRPENAAPVRIRRGAFADNLPHRDLLLSPEHCILADGRLIAAKCLVNGTTIVQDLDRPSIEYFHIETAPHSVVLAEGLPAETYLDTGNRSFFDNAGAALVLHPEFHINTAFRRWNTDSCAPLAITPAEIEPTWHRLAARAESLGHAAPVLVTTSDAAPRLLVQGRVIAPIEADATKLVFLLPEGTADATLVSRFGSPADTAPYLNDHRRLGIAIRHMVLRAGADERIVPADHPGLTRGWHPVERDDAGSAWRWTEGRAHLPLGKLAGPTVLELHLAGAMTYRIDPPEAARQAA